MTICNAEIIEAFRNRQALGKRGDSAWTDVNTIFSYQTPIAKRISPTDEVALVKDKYSHTTSVLQNSIRASFNCELVAAHTNFE